MHVKFLKVFEAITLIIQSIVYQNRLKANNKPTICALNSSLKFRTVYVDHEQASTITSLENHLFGPVNYLFIFIKLYNNVDLNFFFSPKKKKIIMLVFEISSH